METRPDILVLGGGGRQGDAWMTGLLAGLEDANGFDLRECDYLVGTSAGAIVATKLASGRVLRRPSEQVAAASVGQSQLPSRGLHAAMTAAAPFAQLGLRVGRMPREALRAAVLRAVPRMAIDTLDFGGSFPPDGARFDGRLRLVAVDRHAGRRVVFGAPGAPEASVAQALAASCALPLVFAPAAIAGREYVDGAAWSPTNADVAPAGRDTRVLILAPMASLHGPFPAAARVLARTATLVEASALTARGARVRMIAPDRASAVAIGRNLMSAAELDASHLAGYRQGQAL